jgi:hypothetical protein
VAAKPRWVLLAYRLPREPSTPRIAAWRRLRQLGAAQIGDGLAALPHDEHTKEQFEWLAQFVEDSGGDASVWISEPTTAAQHRALAAQMKEAVAADYRTVIDAAAAAKRGGAQGRRTALRLRKTLERIKSRDFFPPPERKSAERAVAQLLSLVEARR